MKKSASFLAFSVALTLVFYLLAYFILPPPPPSAAVMVLFAAVACGLVWSVQSYVVRVRAKKSKPTVLPVLLFAAAAMLASCKSAAPPPSSSTSEASSSPPNGASTASRAPASDAEADYPLPPKIRPPIPRRKSQTGAVPSPPKPVAVSLQGTDSPPLPTPVSVGSPHISPIGAPRITGTALLIAGDKEPSGFGLYSYALLNRAPTDAEKPRYRAFFKSLLQLPTAASLGQYVPESRINVTYIPLTAAGEHWESWSVNLRVEWVMATYDYARSAAIASSLGQKLGPGPILMSVLTPATYDARPHPVLLQDLSAAEPVLMADYVTRFVQQAGIDQFWQPSALESFALGLRNILEVAADGLGMSKEAVVSWIKFPSRLRASGVAGMENDSEPCGHHVSRRSFQSKAVRSPREVA